MPRLSLPAVSLLALTAALAAQTKTLPRNSDTSEGNTNHWPGWDLASSTGPTYLPARADYSYDAAVFPWDPKSVKVVLELRVRQDTTLRGVFNPHTKSCAIWMSTDGFKAKQPRFNWEWDATHGRNKVNAFKRKTVNFVASPRSNGPAKFDTVFKLDTPYRVLPNSKNLVIQYNAYTATSIGGRWRPDARFTASSLSRGAVARFGTGCPVDWFVSNYLTWSCGDFTQYVDTGLQSAPVAVWIGDRLRQPIQVPGTQCFLYVNPLLVQARLSERSTRGRALFWWGALPALPGGVRIGYQFAVFRSGYPVLGQFGLSRGAEYTLGNGWTSAVEFGSVYAYGANLDQNDPDRARVASFLSTTGVVWQILP